MQLVGPERHRPRDYPASHLRAEVHALATSGTLAAQEWADPDEEVAELAQGLAAQLDKSSSRLRSSSLLARAVSLLQVAEDGSTRRVHGSTAGLSSRGPAVGNTGSMSQVGRCSPK